MQRSCGEAVACTSIYVSFVLFPFLDEKQDRNGAGMACTLQTWASAESVQWCRNQKGVEAKNIVGNMTIEICCFNGQHFGKEGRGNVVNGGSPMKCMMGHAMHINADAAFVKATEQQWLYKRDARFPQHTSRGPASQGATEENTLQAAPLVWWQRTAFLLAACT